MNQVIDVLEGVAALGSGPSPTKKLQQFEPVSDKGLPSCSSAFRDDLLLVNLWRAATQKRWMTYVVRAHGNRETDNHI